MLILNATVVSVTDALRLVPGQGVYVSAGQITEVGASKEIEEAHPRTRKLDAAGCLLLPGSISAHTHLYRTLAPGLGQADRASSEPSSAYRQHWRRSAESLSAEDIRWSSLLGLIDAIRHGTTTLFDHHSSPSVVDGSLDIIADTVRQAGLRAVLCYGVADSKVPGDTDSAIRENARFLKRCAEGSDTAIAGMFGLEDSPSLSGATIQACRAAASDGTGFHVHVAEFEEDQYDSLAKTGMRIVDRLKNHEVLGPSTIAAQCAHVDFAEAGALAATGTYVAQLPRSNMRTGVGTLPVEGFLRAGIRVCMGNDGLRGGMWDEWQAAYLQKTAERPSRRATAPQVVAMGMQNGAELAQQAFPGQHFGGVEPGAVADLVLVQNTTIMPATSEKLAEDMIWALPASSVKATIAAGKVLMQDGKLLKLDEDEIRARARESAVRVWHRYEEHGGA